MPHVCDVQCPEKNFNSCGTGPFAKTQHPCNFLEKIAGNYNCNKKGVVN